MAKKNRKVEDEVIETVDAENTIKAEEVSSVDADAVVEQKTFVDTPVVETKADEPVVETPAMYAQDVTADDAKSVEEKKEVAKPVEKKKKACCVKHKKEPKVNPNEFYGIY